MPTANTLDGRTARRLANRNKILDAALELVADGASLGAEAVAARAEVSVRSVYNHFPTERDLVAGLYERGTELVRPLLAELPPPTLAFGDRVAKWVRVWARIQEEIAQVRWQALIAEDQHPEFQPELDDLRRAHLQELKHRFPEISGRRTLASARAITDSLAWRSLRKHQRLSFDAACDVVEETLKRLVD
jgi:AcrR family transcriptional regulator